MNTSKLEINKQIFFNNIEMQTYEANQNYGCSFSN